MKSRFLFFIAVLVMFVLGIFMTAASAFAQPAMGLQVPAPSDPSYSQVLAHLASVDDVIIGANMPSNAGDYAIESKRTLDRAKTHLSAGKSVTIRVSFFVDMRSTSWQVLAGGQTGAGYFYPVPGPNSGLWVIEGKHLLAQAKMLADWMDANKIPRGRVRWCLGNEAAPGGAGGPYLTNYSRVGATNFSYAYSLWDKYQVSRLQADYDKFKANWLTIYPSWTLIENPDDTKHPRPLHEGEIPARYFTMRYVIRSQAGLFGMGFGVVGCSNEQAGDPSVEGTPAWWEVQSWNSAEAQKLVPLLSELDFNSYDANPLRSIKDDTNGDGIPDTWHRRFLTPDEMAVIYWLPITIKRANAMRSIPGMPGKVVGVMESNFHNTSGLPSTFRWTRTPAGWVQSPWLATDNVQSVQEYNAFQYRQTQMTTSQSLTVVWRVGWFTSTASDPLTITDPIWRLDAAGKLQPIGGVLFP